MGDLTDPILRSEAATEVFTALAEHCNRQARDKGFWKEDHGHHTTGTKLNLIHAEVSEATEAGRKAQNAYDLGSRWGNSHPSEHIPEFTGTEEELADAVIRILDLARERQCRLWEAILAKLDFNAGREYMHGKNT